ncbi:MAG: hypothetical protein IT260_16220 [Saprospiraceae bacterium]|nr:hypothetical protein [Saprospiraceae bacterium]
MTHIVLCPKQFLLCLSFLSAFFLLENSLPAQPADIHWLSTVKTPKDQRTLLLLNAGPEGFQLLRWQDRRVDVSGNVTPAMPLLTILTPAGERLHEEPLPGFADGQLLFRFAIASDSLLLVAYEAPDAIGRPTLYLNRLNVSQRQWVGAPQVVFTDHSGRAPAFASAWFNAAADGRHFCIYQSESGQSPRISVAVFNRSGRLEWQRAAVLPPQSGWVTLRRVLCTGRGDVVVHARIFTAGGSKKDLGIELPPTAYRLDGRPMLRSEEWATELPPYANALFVVVKEVAELGAYYLDPGEKYTPALELAEDPQGRIWAAGLTHPSDNTQADGYFVYALDPGTRQGQMLQNAALPASVRKAFSSKKNASGKEPIAGVDLCWMDWAADGKPWLLLEQYNAQVPPGRVETAALLRLDSTYRITAARRVEKYQRLQGGDPQNYASIAPCRAPKGGWWLLWNQGHWPETKLMLTECRPGGEPEDFVLTTAAQSNVTMLPQTLLYRDGKWYFAGESEYHERIRIGVVEVLKKGK